MPSLRVPASLGDNEAAVLDTFVVPAYLRAYWELARRLLLVGEAARVAHLRCMTGYPDGDLLQTMPNTTGVGVDESGPCINLARSKVSAFGFEYVQGSSEATGLEGGTFSHVLLLHPPGSVEARAALFREAARLLYPGGQLVVGLPLGQSFPEIMDLLAEFELKYDDAQLTAALEVAHNEHSTVESVSDELEACGLGDVDFELEDQSLGFDSGRSLLEDPSARFLIVPQLLDWLHVDDLTDAMAYVARAVDKYWSGERMDLTMKLGAFSARR